MPLQIEVLKMPFCCCLVPADANCLSGHVQDAMETAAQSGDPEIAEELLRFYVEQKERECFAAALFTCYDLIRPDVALEVSRSCHHLAFLHLMSLCRPSIYTSCVCPVLLQQMPNKDAEDVLCSAASSQGEGTAALSLFVAGESCNRISPPSRAFNTAAPLLHDAQHGALLVELDSLQYEGLCSSYTCGIADGIGSELV